MRLAVTPAIAVENLPYRVLEEFWAALSPPDENGCQIVLRRTQTKGYIQIKIDGRMVLIHRLAWAIENRRWPPKDRVVRHRCDTPKCAAPAHLELGTDLQNAEDRVQRGRQVNAPRLTEERIQLLCEARGQGLAYHVIGARYGHTPETVKRHTRRHGLP